MRKIITFDGSDDIVIVVPTADITGIRFKEFLISVKQHTSPVPTIVAVESSGSEFRFSKSMNDGIRKAMDLCPEYIVLSNDDVRFSNYWLSRLLEAFQTGKTIAFAIPKIVDSRGNWNEGLYELPSPLEFMLMKLAITFLPASVSSGLATRLWELRYTFGSTKFHKLNNKPLRTSSLNGFIIDTQPLSVFPAKNLISLGLFDEEYLNGLEDWDLSFRVYLSGMKSSVQLDSTVTHDISATGGRGWTRPKSNTGSQNLSHLLKKYTLNQLFCLRRLCNEGRLFLHSDSV